MKRKNDLFYFGSPYFLHKTKVDKKKNNQAEDAQIKRVNIDNNEKPTRMTKNKNIVFNINQTNIAK